MPEYLTFLLTLASTQAALGEVEIALKIHRSRLPGFENWRRHGGHTTKELQTLVTFLPEMYRDMPPKKYKFIFSTVTVGPSETETSDNDALLSSAGSQSDSA